MPESQLDAVTALSGSGPAYFFFLVEAMIDAGILLGLPRTLADELIVQTLFGSAVMLRDSGEHPVRLREGGHLAGRHHHRGHPGAGAARRPVGLPVRDRGRQQPLGRAGRRR